MLTIVIKAKLSCSKHKGFDPAKTGESAIKANCKDCWLVHDAHMKTAALREFLSKAKQILEKPAGI